MDFFGLLTMVGGLCLFLFGMAIMGQALERRAGNKLRSLLSTLTSNKLAGLLTGLGVTAIIQSSSATTVMVVGFVNSGLMSLKQSISVIMGANIGTTVTSWILSLSGIASDSFFIKLLKPTSFTPILALIGIIYYMFSKSSKRKDTGMILLGFATLMFGMDTMSAAVKGLANVPAFQNLFLLFKNPILGMLAGAVLTAIIQSSSASVGILQALAITGQVSYGAAIPIIMGQNIGTCVTALISSVGANKNAKRAALVHLSFNVIGTIVLLAIFCIISWLLKPVVLDASASLFGIAVCHSIFNVLCTILLLPTAGILEKLAVRLVPDAKTPEVIEDLDERLLATPPMALARCRAVANIMSTQAMTALRKSLKCIDSYSRELAEEIHEIEEQTDQFEDKLGTYLVKLSAKPISEADNREAAMLLKSIGDFERISDHSVNLLEAIEEMHDKTFMFSKSAYNELGVLFEAVDEILQLTEKAFNDNDLNSAYMVEPLEQVIDKLKEEIRSRHIMRLQQGTCSIEAGFVWSDLLTNLERTSDHCSNIAGGIIDMSQRTMNIHQSLRTLKSNSASFKEKFEKYSDKYSLTSF